MSGCGTVLPPYTQYLYSDFYCLEHQLCWKDRTAWKRNCSPPGARSVEVEDQSRTHDTQPLGEILTAGYATRPGSWEPEGFLLPSWACSYSYPEQLAEVVLESGLCTWWQFTGLQMRSVGPLHKKIHLIFFHESHCISSARFSTSLTRPTRAGPCLLTPCCPPATSRTVFEARREQL